jgi:hypothetical protein
MMRAQCPPHLFLDVTRARVFADESLRRRTTTASNFDWRFLPLHAIDQRKNRNASRGDRNMLDAIQISLALWAMIVCGGVKAVQLLHYLF